MMVGSKIIGTKAVYLSCAQKWKMAVDYKEDWSRDGVGAWRVLFSLSIHARQV
jgi:hypothetical protein